MTQPDTKPEGLDCGEFIWLAHNGQSVTKEFYELVRNQKPDAELPEWLRNKRAVERKAKASQKT